MTDPISGSAKGSFSGIAGSGDGAGAVRIVRPNLRYIADLRGSPLPDCRPREIHNIVVVDDRLNSAKITAMMIASKIGKLVGREIQSIPLDRILSVSRALEGYNICYASTREEISAVPEILKLHRMDFAFIDHDMYDLDGPALIRKARTKKFNGIVIGMTAHLNFEERNAAFLESGADAAIDKTAIEPRKYFTE